MAFSRPSTQSPAGSGQQVGDDINSAEIGDSLMLKVNVSPGEICPSRRAHNADDEALCIEKYDRINGYITQVGRSKQGESSQANDIEDSDSVHFNKDLRNF